MLAKAPPSASVPPGADPRFITAASTTGTATLTILRTTPSGNPNAPATLLAIIGVAKPVTILMMFIASPCVRPPFAAKSSEYPVRRLTAGQRHSLTHSQGYYSRRARIAQ